MIHDCRDKPRLSADEQGSSLRRSNGLRSALQDQPSAAQIAATFFCSSALF